MLKNIQPTTAQFVEWRTAVVKPVILRSLVRIRQVGIFFFSRSIQIFRDDPTLFLLLAWFSTALSNLESYVEITTFIGTA